MSSINSIPNLDNFPDFRLDSAQPLGSLLRAKAVQTYHEAIHFIRALPYYPISDVNDLELVFKERQGTCSTKHGFLAALARENKLNEIKIKLLYYPFYAHYLKDLEEKFQERHTDHVLEAHFILDYFGYSLDVSSSKVDLTPFYSLDTAFKVETLEPKDIGSDKQKEYISLFKKWCKEKGFDFEPLWNLKINVIKQIIKLDQKK